jgi:hypothetical protein
MVLNRYAAALLSIGILAITAFIAIPEGERTLPSILQFGALVVGLFATYLLPLLPVRWAGVLKTGAAIVFGVIGALVPLISTGTLTTTQILVVMLAGLNALAVEMGVQIRKDSALIDARDSGVVTTLESPEPANSALDVPALAASGIEPVLIAGVSEPGIIRQG